MHFYLLKFVRIYSFTTYQVFKYLRTLELQVFLSHLFAIFFKYLNYICILNATIYHYFICIINIYLCLPTYMPFPLFFNPSMIFMFLSRIIFFIPIELPLTLVFNSMGTLMMNNFWLCLKYFYFDIFFKEYLLIGQNSRLATIFFWHSEAVIPSHLIYPFI